MLDTDMPVTLAESLDRAANTREGMNFHDDAGNLAESLSYRELRRRALNRAARLCSLGLSPGARVAIVADTSPTFVSLFFACQYAGMVPVPLPAYPQVGGAEAYVSQIRRLLFDCSPSVAVASDQHAAWLVRAAHGISVAFAGSAAQFDVLPSAVPFDPAAPACNETSAYIQFTSGSTSAPRGAVISQRAAMTNLKAIFHHAVAVTERDRFTSWLPFYHDMGLVAFLLGPVFTALSVDYLSPRAFAKRPRLWLKLISDHRSTLSSSPPSGYALCAKRLRERDVRGLDLTSWRVACVGSERIHADHLEAFVRRLRPCGFDPRAFVACYGMAECVLAISMAPLGLGIERDRVDHAVLAETGWAKPANTNVFDLVMCGSVLPGYDLAIVDAEGRSVPRRRCGGILVRGPMLMDGYFNDEAATQSSIDRDGWLDTGDIGYRIGDQLVVTARSKDVIIINGRNLWPEDLEHLAEQVDGIGFGRACAFAVEQIGRQETAVIVVESRRASTGEFSAALGKVIREHFGIKPIVEVVVPGTLPRTSSGKLCRTRARADYLQRSGRQDTLAASTGRQQPSERLQTNGHGSGACQRSAVSSTIAPS